MAKKDADIKGGGVGNFDNAIDSVPDKLLADQIEEYLLDAGSDHLQTFGGNFEGGIQLQQVPDEFANFIADIIESGRKVDSYMEIGSAAGGTVYAINHFFNCSTIVLIDDNRHPKAHVRPYILRDILRNEIIGDSHHPNTLKVAAEYCQQYDMVMIDGDHSYHGVKKDYEMYASLVRVGGLLVFHDSAIVYDPGLVGVFMLIDELCSDIDNGRNKNFTFVKEYVTEKYQRVCGIAVFEKVKAGGGCK